MSVKNVNQLIKKVKKDIYNKLSEERVQNKFKDVNRRNVASEVYAVYENTRPRRADDGGLTDPDNISVLPSETANGVRLDISNNTEPRGFDEVGVNSDFLAPIVEYGTGGDARWQQPRPFMKSTEEELKRGDLITKVIKEIDYIK